MKKSADYAVIPCGCERNRRSGITLAMHQRLQWFIHQRARGVRTGNEHPAYTVLVGYGTLQICLWRVDVEPGVSPDVLGDIGRA